MEQLEDFQHVRSESSIRLDLARWGFKWRKNGKEPYYIGHERADVVKHRDQLVNFFITNKHRFYQQTSDDDPKWVEPT